MSTEIPSRSTATQGKRSPVLNGYAMFAVAIMFVLALWQVLAGLTVLARDGLYVDPPGYVFAFFDLTVWGWVLALLGVLGAVAGVAVVQGRAWGDTTAIVVACLSMTAHFLLIPFYPIWSLVIVALNVAIVWALTNPDYHSD